MPLRAIGLSLVLVMTAACAPIERSPESPYFAPPEGSRLTLLRPVTIPADEASVWIQDGETVRYWNADRYRPHCKLEMWTRAGQRRTIEPDTFVVERVVRTERAVSRDVPTRLAAAPGWAGLDDDGGPMAYIMSTELFLESARQPDVHRLTCEVWGDENFPQHVSIAGVRDTLGDLFRLELAQ